jgi:diguanylate cyclase (GGDEF)-like protein
LCRDDAQRERVLDMERRLKPVRAVAFGILAVALLLSGPWMGWWPLGIIGVVIAAFVTVDRNLERFARPELWLAGVWALAQLLIAVAIFLTGGPSSPAVAWLAIPVVTLGARFDLRGVVAGGLYTAALMLAVTLGGDPAAVLGDPPRALGPLALLGAVTVLSTALMASDIHHRTESVIDGLTGMLNRRALNSRLEELAAQAEITGEPIGLIVGDIDRFKSINDEHGHAVGDAVLVDVAYALRKELRAFDLAYRMGGEEFLIVLPGATLEESAIIAERLREAIASAPRCGLDVTMSFGVANSGSGTFDHAAVLAAADAAMYEAKAAGRNRVVRENDRTLIPA